MSKVMTIIVTLPFTPKNYWTASWLTVKILKSFFAYAQLVPDVKKMSQTCSSSSSHKKRKYSVNDAIDFVSYASRLVSPLFLSFFSYLNLVFLLLYNNKVVNRGLSVPEALRATKYPCTRQYLHKVCQKSPNPVLVITIEDSADVSTLLTEDSEEVPKVKQRRKSV